MSISKSFNCTREWLVIKRTTGCEQRITWSRCGRATLHRAWPDPRVSVLKPVNVMVLHYCICLWHMQAFEDIRYLVYNSLILSASVCSLSYYPGITYVSPFQVWKFKDQKYLFSGIIFVKANTFIPATGEEHLTFVSLASPEIGVKVSAKL